jgi:dihydrolipoamide dehydrogenase
VPSGNYDCDLLVLGSGPGGYTAAFRAADLGLKVVLVERYPTLGGVCLNVGCIPSKALLHVAKVIDDARSLGAHGVAFGEPQIDLDKIRAWKADVVGRRTQGLAGLAKQRKIEVAHGTATLTDAHTVEIVAANGGKRALRFAQAILAAGSRVVEIPGLPYDDPRVLDSTRALELKSVPGRLLVVGGGIIGLEMATFFRALGSRITVVELLEGLIPGCDRDLVRPLQKKIEPQYEAIHLKTKVARIEAQPDGLRATFEGEKAPEPQTYDAVLVAVGRRPNGDRVGAQAAGIAVDERGFVKVDRQQRTNVPHIFAIGDLTGNPMLAHKAEHEGKVAAEVAAGKKSAMDARVIPSVAYTDPEVAWVGLTETDAKARGVAVERAAFPWTANARADTLMSPEGTTKLLFDPATHRLVGAGITGANAGDLIAELALAIEMGCEAADLALTVHPHPTLSETVMKAAEVHDGSITDLLPSRRKK